MVVLVGILHILHVVWSFVIIKCSPPLARHDISIQNYYTCHSRDLSSVCYMNRMCGYIELS